MKSAAVTLVFASFAAFAPAESTFGTIVHVGAYEARDGGGVTPGGSKNTYIDNTGKSSARAEESILAGSGSAYADLASGKMGVGAFANFQTESQTLVYAWGRAQMWDLVTLFRNDSPATRLPLQLNIDGSLEGNAGRFVDVDMDGASQRYTITGPFTTIDYSLLVPLTSSYTFKFKIGMDAGAAINRDGNGAGYADFSHTLHFNWSLPAGMTYTSASGVFNPAPITQPVPEPASLAALGLGIAGALRRRRATKGR